MKKKLYFPRRTVARVRKSGSEPVRDAISATIQERPDTNLVAIWDGAAACAAINHDSVYDTP